MYLSDSYEVLSYIMILPLGHYSAGQNILHIWISLFLLLLNISSWIRKRLFLVPYSEYYVSDAPWINNSKGALSCAIE